MVEVHLKSRFQHLPCFVWSTQRLNEVEGFLMFDRMLLFTFVLRVWCLLSMCEVLISAHGITQKEKAAGERRKGRWGGGRDI